MVKIEVETIDQPIEITKFYWGLENRKYTTHNFLFYFFYTKNKLINKKYESAIRESEKSLIVFV